jgi:hypothetical protein
MVSTSSPNQWKLSVLAGRITEITGGRDSASLTLVSSLIAQAQQAGDPVAWVARSTHLFFPPDMAKNGVNLEALPVIWASDTPSMVRVTDYLIRSGSFSLIVLDLDGHTRIQPAVLGRLVRLAGKHHTAVVCVSPEHAPLSSLGSMVSLRGTTKRVAGSSNRYRCTLEVVKDKRSGPGWRVQEVCYGPAGLH